MRQQTIAVIRGSHGSPASRVLEQVRGRGVAFREELAAVTGLSQATVARSVVALAEAGLIRERASAAREGRLGRPSIPVSLVTDRHACIGVHIGRWVTTVALGDLAGRVVESVVLRHEQPGRIDLGGVVAALLDRHLERTPLSAAVVAPWRSLALDSDPLADRLETVLGLPVGTADHVAAIAAAEFIHRRHGTGGITCYVYARDTAGFTLVIDKGAQTEVATVTSLAHYPTGSAVRCWCGRTGCFEVTVSDHALVARAVDNGLVDVPRIEALRDKAAAGDREARRMFDERARWLGEVAAGVRDMTAPDRTVLVGQAFTGFPPALGEVVASFERSTSLPPGPLSVTRFGDDIQAVAACAMAMGPVYDDPLGLVGRWGATG